MIVEPSFSKITRLRRVITLGQTLNISTKYTITSGNYCVQTERSDYRLLSFFFFRCISNSVKPNRGSNSDFLYFGYCITI